MKSLIFADDLTGSMESALVAFRSGQSVELCFPWTSGEAPASNGHETVVMDTETRNLPEPLAEERLAELLGECGTALSYKKIDSTLRGNVVAEIRGIDAALGLRLQEMGHQKKRILVFCPALPEQGRSIVGGRVLVRGIALEDTEYAHDPLKPAGSGDTIALMRRAGYEAGLIGLGTIRLGPDFIGSEIRALIRNGFRCVIPDAETRGDLLSIALAIRSLEQVPDGADKTIHGEYDFLPIGSAGLLEALFHTGRFVPIPDMPAVPEASLAAIGTQRIPHLIIVSGSRSAATLSQLGLLRATGSLEQYQVFAPAEDGAGIGMEGAQGADGQRRAASGVAVFEEKVRDCAVKAEREILLFPDSVLFLTGGHTAQIVLETLGIGGAEILGEPAPLVPLCRAKGGRCDGLRFMTKAGGFGAPTLFGDLLESAGRKE